jgi:hypothetical protein
MDNRSPQPVAAAVPARGVIDHSYVDWAAVLAGTAVAAAISLVLLTFGSAIGFSMTSPFEGKGASKPVVMAALGLWTLLVVVFSSAGGGYLTGRLRRRIGDATEHEVEVRDGAHGLVLWAAGVLLASLLAASGIGTLIRGVQAVEGRTDPTSFVVDNLFRSEDARLVNDIDQRHQVARLLTQGMVAGELKPEDRTYLARVVAARADLSRAEAERRVDQVLADAKQAADTARKTAIVTAFLTAAALLAGAAAASFGAVMGGRHRDRGTVFRALVGWR